MPSSPASSTLTTSQLPTSSNTAITPSSTTEIVTFQQETQKQLAIQEKATKDTLSMFRNELAKAGASAAEFQRLVLSSQQQNNACLETLENSMSQLIQGTQRIEQLLTNDGRSAILEQNHSEEDSNSGTLQRQGGNP